MMLPPCRNCGLCCISLYDQEVFCDIHAEDLPRLSPAFIRHHVVQDATGAAIKTAWRQQQVGPLKGYKVCACVALRGSVFHRVSCRIYTHRPQTCHEAVRRGDGTCRNIVKMFRQFLKEQTA